MKYTNRVGVITPFFTAPSFVQRLRGVASTLSRANYELAIYPVDSVEHLQGYISSIPIMGNLNGLIIMSLAIEDKDVRRLIENGMQTVLIEFSHDELNSIVINDEQGGRLVAEYLIKKGHRSFGFLGDIEPPERYAIHPVKSRLVGFRATLQEAGFSATLFGCMSAMRKEKVAMRSSRRRGSVRPKMRSPGIASSAERRARLAICPRSFESASRHRLTCVMYVLYGSDQSMKTDTGSL